MLAEVGYRTSLNESTWMISRRNLRIGTGHKYKNVYPLIAVNLEAVVNVAENIDPNLWHGRLGHMSQAGLDQLMTVGALHSETTSKDELLRALLIRETESLNSVLSPL